MHGLLSILIWLPIGAGLAVLLLGERRIVAGRWLALAASLATLALSVYLFVIIPKGFFPQQDTGLITGVSEAAQDISFAAMRQYQQALGDIVLKDPARHG